MKRLTQHLRKLINYMKKRIDAFGYALSGLFAGISNEIHLKIHFVAVLIVTFFGYYFHLTGSEWIALIVCCGLVISAELFNTAIERTCDLISKERNQEIKYIKDVSAAAVFVLSVASISVACVIFSKRLLIYL